MKELHVKIWCDLNIGGIVYDEVKREMGMIIMEEYDAAIKVPKYGEATTINRIKMEFLKRGGMLFRLRY